MLEDLLDQWEKDADKNGLDALKKQALLLHMSQDPARLRNELYKMKRRLIPDGLYIMDQKWPQKDLPGYIYGVLRHDRNYPSILKIIAKQKALDWETIKAGPDGTEVESLAEKLVLQLIENKGPDWLPEGYQEFVLDIVNNVRSSKEAKIYCAHLMNAT